MDILKDLELLILSRYPVIAVETYEEERLAEALQLISEKLDIPFFVWTVTEGLKRNGLGKEIYDTLHPLKALNNLAAIEGDGIYFLQDLVIWNKWKWSGNCETSPGRFRSHAEPLFCQRRRSNRSSRRAREEGNLHHPLAKAQARSYDI